jgi:hypothetical protein
MARGRTPVFSYVKTNVELSDPAFRLVEVETDAELIRSNVKAQSRVKDISITECPKRKIASTTIPYISIYSMLMSNSDPSED